VSDYRRLAFVTGISIGAVLGLLNLTPFTLVGLLVHLAAFTSVGVVLIYRLQRAGAPIPPPAEAARIGAISGLAAGVAARFVGVVLTVSGVFARVPDPVLFEFQERWGIDYFTGITLSLIFGAAVIASIGAALAAAYVKPARTEPGDTASTN